MNVEHRFFPEVATGLSSDQISTRKREGAVNTPVDPPSKSVKDIVRGNLLTYFNLVFLIISILLIIAGSFRDLTFLPVIIANTLIGIIQEIRSKNVLDKLTMLNAPRTKVVREGREQTIPSSELVLDDIVIFSAGDQIPADASVRDGQVQVNESLITGESDEIVKEQDDALLSGSFIVSGKCYAQLEAVGEESYISRLTLEAKKSRHVEKTEMIRSLDRLVLVAGILIIPIGIILFVQQFVFAHDTFQNSITSMVAAVIGMIPEGLYLLASVALAVSTMRLAHQKVLVHDMKCIEMLARVDVLCVDKTGTITDNAMNVKAISPLKPEVCSEEECLKKLTDFAAVMDADNITMKALQEYLHPRTRQKAMKTVPFSSVYKYSAAVISEEETFILGAPENLLKDSYEQYEEQIRSFGSKGYRVLVFGTVDYDPDGKDLEKPADPLGLLVLSNEIRPEAPDTFAYFAEQGVAIKVISGDNPVTVSEVALEAGIEGAENYVDARLLQSPEDIEEAMEKYTVFGRVTPDQKRSFVQALQKKGHTVAMTGDGVNDVLALKDADCGIAMASGSDAASQAADLVLLDSNFACMPGIVAEGRRVVNNITRSASLFLVKNLFSLMLAVFSMAFMLNYPLQPSQISLISMFTIGIPGFFLAMQPNDSRIQGHFIANVLVAALPAGITDAFVVGALVIFGDVFGVASEDISVASTFLLAIVGLMILYRISSPLNLYRGIVWAGCGVSMLFCIFYMHDLFAISGISLQCGMLFVVFAICTEPLLRYLTLFFEWLHGIVHNILQGIRYLFHKEKTM